MRHHHHRFAVLGLSGSGLGFASWACSVAGFRAEFEKELE